MDQATTMEPQNSALVAPVASAAPTDGQSKWAKPEDWIKFKNTISALFMCHSLPNVMRIMREDFDFHATPKMYQVHIYQKWGLRKGRPEPKKKGNKRRRREATEESEEPEGSTASSTHRHKPAVGVHFSEDTELFPDGGAGAGAGLGETGQADLVHTPQHLMRKTDPNAIAADNFDAGWRSREQPFFEGPASWQQFLSKAPMDGTTLPERPAPFQFVGSQTTDPTTDPSIANESWMSTVMTSTPATSIAGSSHGNSSHSSRKSNKSARSRVSGASSSRETLLSSSTASRMSRASFESRMTLPSGSLRLLDSPDGLLFPEKSMFFARHYISSTFSTGLWTLSQNTDPSLLDTECVKLDAWYNDFNPGFEFLYYNRDREPDRIKRAFCIFQRCFAATESIIKPQDPRLVIYICQQTIRFMFYDTVGRNLAQTFLRYVSGLCKKLFSEHHPLYIIMSQLARMDNFEFATNAPALMNCYFDHLEPFLEQSSTAFSFVNDLRGLTVSIMEATGMLGIYEAKPVLDRLLRRACTLGHNSLHLKIEQAAMFQRNRYLVEARDILREVRSSEAGRNDPYESTYAGIILMVVLRKMKDTEGGIHLGYEMVDFLTRTTKTDGTAEFNWELFKGFGQSTLMIFLGKLEVELRDAHRWVEADNVKRELDKVMEIQYEYDKKERVEDNFNKTVVAG